MGDAIATILGALAAIGGGLAAQWYTHRCQTTHARKTIAAAFGGEICAVCSIARRRGYLEALERLRDIVKQSKQPDRLLVRVTREPFLIFSSNAREIGSLPPDLARDVARFYTQASSLIEDFSPNSFQPASAEDAIQTLTEQIALLRDCLNLGDDLVRRLTDAAA